MKNRKNIYIIYPKSLSVVSTDSLAMTDLLLNELIFSQNNRINFHINNKLRLIECNDLKVKKTLDLLQKSRKLSAVKKQMMELIHKDDCIGDMLGKLIFFIGDKKSALIIKEINSGPDFTWEVIHDFE